MSMGNNCTEMDAIDRHEREADHAELAELRQQVKTLRDACQKALKQIGRFQSGKDYTTEEAESILSAALSATAPEGERM